MATDLAGKADHLRPTETWGQRFPKTNLESVLMKAMRMLSLMLHTGAPQ